MEINFWGGFGLVALGALIAEVFEFRAWRRYKEGKAEATKIYAKR